MNNRSTLGFTLSELLVSLAVLGLIAAFAIPKVLSSVAESSTKAIGKEAISMITSAYDGLKAENDGIVSRATTAANLINRMNGAAAPTGTTPMILELQSGGRLSATAADDFARGTANEGCVLFNVDPDGAGNFGPVTVALGYDGRVWTPISAVDYAAGTAVTAPTGPLTVGGVTYNLAGSLTIANAGSAAGTDTTWFEW